MMDIHKAIGRLPRPKRGFVLPKHKYTGPWNPLEKQLDKNDKPISGEEPYNAVDSIAMRHDICYRDHAHETGGKHGCDDKMIEELDMLEPRGLRERIDKSIVRLIIGTKRKYGMGIEWTDELTDELHKPVRRKFRKRTVYAQGVDEIWAADLVDMQYYSIANKGFKYILMIIDVFSKYGWAIPIKNKSGPEIVRAFTELWDNEGQNPPKFLWTDKGKEFDNELFQNLLQEKNVHMYWTENEEKSCIVERWNRTIKRNMWKYFTKHRTGVYINILPELIQKYNSTYHQSIKCSPTDARSPANYAHVFNALYNKNTDLTPLLKKQPKFRVDDTVRIVKKKKTFEKGYTTNWTEELFTVIKVQPTFPFTYKIEDTQGEEVKGTFYEPELQLAKPQTTFKIEKVLRKRTTKEGKKELYVKWLGYSKDFNQWIPAEDVEK